MRSKVLGNKETRCVYDKEKNRANSYHKGTREKKRTHPGGISIQSWVQLYHLPCRRIFEARPKIEKKESETWRKEGRKEESATRILCIASRVSTRNIFFLREASPFFWRLVNRGIKRPPSVTPAFSLLSAGIHKKSYVLRGGDIPLSKKRQLGLAFDPLVTVNARLRGISRFPLIVRFPGKSFLSFCFFRCSV